MDHLKQLTTCHKDIYNDYLRFKGKMGCKQYVELFKPTDIETCSRIAKDLDMLIPHDVDVVTYVNHALPYRLHAKETSIAFESVFSTGEDAKFPLDGPTGCQYRISNEVIKCLINLDNIAFSMTDIQLQEYISRETFHKSRHDLIKAYINSYLYGGIDITFFIPWSKDISHDLTIAYGTKDKYLRYTLDELNSSFIPFGNIQHEKKFLTLKDENDRYIVVSKDYSTELLKLVDNMLTSSKYVDNHDKLQILKTNIVNGNQIYDILDDCNIRILNKYNSLLKSQKQNIISCLSAMTDINMKLHEVSHSSYGSDEAFNDEKADNKSILNDFKQIYKDLDTQCKDFIKGFMLIKYKNYKYSKSSYLTFGHLWDKLLALILYGGKVDEEDKFTFEDVKTIYKTGWYYNLLLNDFISGSNSQNCKCLKI